MADIAWQGNTSTDAEVGSNWIGGTKPGTGDRAVFDSTSNGDCELTAAVSWQAVLMTNATASDFADQVILGGFNLPTFNMQSSWVPLTTPVVSGSFPRISTYNLSDTKTTGIYTHIPCSHKVNCTVQGIRYICSPTKISVPGYD